MSDDERDPQEWTLAPPAHASEEWVSQVNSAVAELLRRLLVAEAELAVQRDRLADVEAQVEALSESLVRHQDDEGKHGR
jgi:hypothetical protein